MISRELKEWRTRHKLSQRRAAEIIGISKTSLIKYETDGPVPKYVGWACQGYSNGLKPMGSESSAERLAT